MPGGSAAAFLVIVSGSPLGSLAYGATEKVEATPWVNVIVGTVAQTGGRLVAGPGGAEAAVAVFCEIGVLPLQPDTAHAAVVAVSAFRKSRRSPSRTESMV